MRAGTPFVLILCVTFVSHSRANADCTAQLKSVDAAKARVVADQNAIRRLAPKVTADELSKWTDASETELRAALIGRLADLTNTYFSGFLNLSSEAVAANLTKPMEIAGQRLPNGIASLGTGQANAIIGSLQREGLQFTSTGAALIRAVSGLSQVRDKAAIVKILSTIPPTLYDTHVLATSRNGVDAAAAAFQVVADLAGKGDFAVAIGTAVFKGGLDILDGLVIAEAVDSLSAAAISTLDGLKTLSANLQKDVQALKTAQGQASACAAGSDSGQNSGPIIYFSADTFKNRTNDHISSIEVEWPVTGSVTSNPQGWVTVGFVQGAIRAGCDSGSGGHYRTVYTPSGKPIRTDRTTAVESCVLGSSRRVNPGEWEVVVCPARKGDRDYPMESDKGEFVSGQSAVSYYGGAFCVNCRLVPDPKYKGQTITVCAPTPPLFTTKVVIELPNHASALVQIR